MRNSFRDFQYYDSYCEPDYLTCRKRELRSARRLGSYTGLAIILSIIFQNLIVVFIQLAGLYDKYYSDAYFSSAADIILSVAGMLLPFVLFGKKMSKASGAIQPLMLSRPRKLSLMPAAVLSGLGFCMLGNIVNSYISAFFGSMGVELTSPEIPMAEGVDGIILTFFRVAITAAIVEELAFRGFVMGNLRFFGDGFAIAVSSVVFALMHGNMVQAPFALMVGFVLGYLSVKTGTVWTAVIIHTLNNSVSTAVYYLTEHLGEEASGVIFLLVLYGIILIGAVSFPYFLFRTRAQRLSPGGSVLTTAEKTKAYFLNLPMLITIGYMLLVTAQYVNAGG